MLPAKNSIKTFKGIVLTLGLDKQTPKNWIISVQTSEFLAGKRWLHIQLGVSRKIGLIPVTMLHDFRIEIPRGEEGDLTIQKISSLLTKMEKYAKIIDLKVSHRLKARIRE